MNLIKNLYTIAINPYFYVMVIIITIVVVAGNFFKGLTDGMKTIIFKYNGVEIDGWSISHVLLYIYFGYYFPEYFIEFLIIGIVWEIFETMFCKESFENIIGCVNSTNFYCQLMDRIKSCDYWYGKLEDIPANVIGFVIGAFLAKKYRKF